MQTQTKAAPAKAAKGKPAPVAPQAPAAPAAMAWQNPQHTQGQKAATAALASLARQGAYVVRLPATSSKLQTLLAGVAGNAAPVQTLPGIVGANAGGWAAFNVGYLGGQNASYAACAAQVGNKKAKANPAFTYALPGGQLLTANGQPWAAPVGQAAHVMAAYAAATAAVQAALNSKCLPAK